MAGTPSHPWRAKARPPGRAKRTTCAGDAHHPYLFQITCTGGSFPPGEITRADCKGPPVATTSGPLSTRAGGHGAPVATAGQRVVWLFKSTRAGDPFGSAPPVRVHRGHPWLSRQSPVRCTVVTRGGAGNHPCGCMEITRGVPKTTCAGAQGTGWVTRGWQAYSLTCQCTGAHKNC